MSDIVTLTGLSGRKYDYYIRRITDDWLDKPGNYVFAGPVSHGILQGWTIPYVGETISLKTRLTGHERWQSAIRLGASHVLAHVNLNAVARLAEERDLIRAYNPPLNVQERTAPAAGFGHGLQGRRALLLSGE